MSVIGTVTKDGMIQLPPEVSFPAGTEVRIEVLEPTAEKKTIWEKLKKFDGVAQGLPSDLAENHDHYLRCTPKRR